MLDGWWRAGPFGCAAAASSLVPRRRALPTAGVLANAAGLFKGDMLSPSVGPRRSLQSPGPLAGDGVPRLAAGRALTADPGLAAGRGILGLTAGWAPPFGVDCFSGDVWAPVAETPFEADLAGDLAGRSVFGPSLLFTFSATWQRNSSKEDSSDDAAAMAPSCGATWGAARSVDESCLGFETAATERNGRARHWARQGARRDSGGANGGGESIGKRMRKPASMRHSFFSQVQSIESARAQESGEAAPGTQPDKGAAHYNLIRLAVY